MNRLYSKNGFFSDKNGGIILLRGVNLAGSSKLPTIPDGTTLLDQTESFTKYRNVSFVVHPFIKE